MAKKLLSSKKAAELLGGEFEVDRLVESGQLTVCRTGSGKRFDMAEVEALAAQRAAEPDHGLGRHPADPD